MLKQRLITAIILIPLVIWSILTLTTPTIAGLLAIFVLLAAWEWAGLCGWQTVIQRSLYVLAMSIGLGIIYGCCAKGHPNNTVILLYGTSFWWLLALSWVGSYQQGVNFVPSHPLIKSLLGFLILLPAWFSLVALHNLNRELLLFLLILIWIADSGAYFVGRRWGKRKLADKISPGKTWEGVAGGILAGSLFATGYALLTIVSLNKILFFILFCMITLFASILGDLLESLFKRQVGLKDSGQLLPGHGGILDRIDSLTAAAPIFSLGLLLLLGI
ncbi:MAG: hypothetical protein BWK79_07845 [Beggiatoa sp. IS2]|nr:MAG: hypothetical protein BWK79_07845 [Beggiatoa sp. IS2]